jgi:hypothetical protein
MFDLAFATFVVGIILLIFLLSLLLSAVNSEPSEGDGEAAEGSPSQQQASKSDNERPIAAVADAIHTYRHYRRADDRRRAKRERETIVVLGLTAILALFAAGAAIWSAVVFLGQLTAMREDQRPWVSTPDAPDSDLTFSDDGAFLRIHHSFKNWGKSPALNVTGYAEMRMRPSPEWAFAREHEICSGLKVRKITRPDGRKADIAEGFTIFPTDHIEPTYNTVMFPPEVLLWRRQPRNEESPLPTVIGCVDYIFSYDGSHHSTGFIYEIDMMGSEGREMLAVPDYGNISKRSVFFSLAPFMTPEVN